MKNSEHSSKSSEKTHFLTTIVGGRPPENNADTGEIPRGIEVLVKKASVDEDFKKTLLDKRSDAAQLIGLELEDSESAVLNSIPGEQLEAIIARTKVKPENRRAFLGTVASLMLAALGATAIYSCVEKGMQFQTMGIDLQDVEPPSNIMPPKTYGQDSTDMKSKENTEQSIEDNTILDRRKVMVLGTRPGTEVDVPETDSK